MKAIEKGIMLQEIEDKGFSLARGAIDRGSVKEVRQQVIDLLQKKGWATSAGGVASSIGYKIGSEQFIDVLCSAMKLESLHALCGEASVRETANQLLGCESYLHPRRMLRVGWPEWVGLNNRVVAHQDHFYVQGEVDTLTVWMPLGDYSRDDGGLEFLSGSHKQGLWPTQVDSAGRFSCGVVDPPADAVWEKLDYCMGDVVIFHSLTVHQSGKNTSDKLRLSLDFRFSSACGEAINDELLPPYAPRVPDWRELTAGWKNPESMASPSTLRMMPKVAQPSPRINHRFNKGSIP